MKYAVSAGGIFVKKREDKYYFLLLKYKDWPGLWFLVSSLDSWGFSAKLSSS